MSDRSGIATRSAFERISTVNYGELLVSAQGQPSNAATDPAPAVLRDRPKVTRGHLRRSKAPQNKSNHVKAEMITVRFILTMVASRKEVECHGVPVSRGSGVFCRHQRGREATGTNQRKKLIIYRRGALTDREVEV
ncbi:hypothetical protein pipiens_015179 [Culex pipiens pipiens]|uniref:Uncharacterized protein n=1 Tax=Culex pipiens pipiens TaxID=38569 RepID=A0ABD1CRK4_CULPP